jgi:uncharacterized OB-fold protein
MSGLPPVDLAINPEDGPFFAALDKGHLAVPWCTRCDDHVWPPRSHCVVCYRPVEEWRTLTGSGEIYSYAVVHRGEGPFAHRHPYVFALVTLDGGPTIMANIVVGSPEDLVVGRRVHLAGRREPDLGPAGAVFVPDGTSTGDR